MAPQQALARRDTYTESITEPAWVYAKACPEALLAYVQLRAMAGGATAIQGWPTANRGYRTVMRNVDSEPVDSGSDDLIYTSVVTKTGDALATAVRRMGDGAGFIYHCAEGQRGHACCATTPTSSTAEGLLPTLIAIHCCAVDPGNWTKWATNDAGGVVWSPLSNLLLYAQTTMIDDARGSRRPDLPRLGLGPVRHQEPARGDEGRQDRGRPPRLHDHRPRDRRDGHDQPRGAAGALLAPTCRPARRRRHSPTSRS